MVQYPAEEQMKHYDDLVRENRVLHERLTQFREATLRINRSLNLEEVLQGVSDSARHLTDSVYGVLVLLDNAGQVEDFLTSGLTAEEHLRLAELPEGPGLCQYLSGISGPLRLRDLYSHLRRLGLPLFQPPISVGPSVSFMSTPIFH